MLVPVAVLGLCCLLVGGAWQLWAGRLSAAGSGRQLAVDDVAHPTRADLRDPARLLEPAKAANLLMVQLELLLLALAGVTVAQLLSTPGVHPALAAVTAATYLVGAGLVGRALYVRLGLAPTVDPPGDESLTASLSRTGDPEMAAAFRAVQAVSASARGDDVDPVTAALLAGARTAADRATVAAWAADAGVADRETVADRARELAAAGVLADAESLVLASRLSGAAADQLVAVADSAVARTDRSAGADA
jgi:hypothetical protein